MELSRPKQAKPMASKSAPASKPSLVRLGGKTDALAAAIRMPGVRSSPGQPATSAAHEQVAPVLPAAPASGATQVETPDYYDWRSEAYLHQRFPSEYVSQLVKMKTRLKQYNDGINDVRHYWVKCEPDDDGAATPCGGTATPNVAEMLEKNLTEICSEIGLPLEKIASACGCASLSALIAKLAEGAEFEDEDDMKHELD
eukprot:4177381-Pyramimonas_sp.AAC.1